MYFDNEYDKYRYAIFDTLDKETELVNKRLNETIYEIKKKAIEESWSYDKEKEEIERRTKVYKKDLEQLREISNGINNFEIKLHETGVVDNTEIESSIKTIEKTYEVAEEDNKDVQKLNQAYRKEKKEFDKELMKSIEDERKKLIDLVDMYYYKKMQVLVDDSEEKYDSLENVIEELTNIGCREAGIQVDYKDIEAVEPSFETQYKIDELEEYEKLSNAGIIPKVSTEKLTFKTKLGFKPVKGTISTKEALIKLSNNERCIKSLQNALFVLRKAGDDGLSQASHYPKTIEMLEKMLKNQEQKLTAFRNDVNVHEIEKVEQVLKSGPEPQSRDKLMATYADLYKRSLTVEVTSEDYRRLTSQMEMVALTNGLSNDDIYEAKENGKKALEAEQEAKKKENDLLKDHEKESTVDGENMSKIVAEVEEEMRNDGYSEPDWEEEKQRRVTQKLAQKDEVSNELLAEKAEKKVDIDSAVDEYIETQENDKRKSFSEQERKDIHTHYNATMDLTKEERAFETLKKDGFLPKDAKLNELNVVQKQILEAQIRQEHDITEAIDKFNECKKQYEEYMKNKRDSKTAVEEVGVSR